MSLLRSRFVPRASADGCCELLFMADVLAFWLPLLLLAESAPARFEATEIGLRMLESIEEALFVRGGFLGFDAGFDLVLLDVVEECTFRDTLPTGAA